MKKRILSIILSIVMLVSLLPTAAFASETAEATWGATADTLTANGTLAQAIDAAEAGNASYIKLARNVTPTATYEITGGTFTLDLNGYDITTTEDLRLFHITGGNITITDTSAQKDGKISAPYYGVICVVAGNLTIAGGCVESKSTSTTASAVMLSTTGAEGILNVTGGAVYAEVTGAATGHVYAVSALGQHAVVNISGGSVWCHSDTNTAKWAHGLDVSNSAVANISGSAQIKATTAGGRAQGIRITSGGTANISGGTVSAEATGNTTDYIMGISVDGTASNPSGLNITGGTIIADDSNSPAAKPSRIGAIWVYDNIASFEVSGATIRVQNPRATSDSAIYFHNSSATLELGSGVVFDTAGTSDIYFWGGSNNGRAGVKLTSASKPTKSVTIDGLSAGKDFTTGWSQLGINDDAIADYFTFYGSSTPVMKNTTDELCMPPYKVSFSTNGKGTVATQYLLEGQEATDPNHTYTGYTLDHWCNKYSCAGDGTCRYDFNTVVTKDISLYARWNTNTYSVTLNPNGGTINTGNITSYTYGDMPILPTNVTKDNFVFGGWYENADFSGSRVPFIPLNATGDKTYYAKWNNIPAVAPEITSAPQGFEGANALTYGSISADKKLSVATDADTGVYDVTYQWYKNTTNSKDGAAAVSGGTAKDLVIESNLNAGDYYYYCKITVARKDNGATASVETDLVKVTVNNATPVVSAPAANDLTYNGGVQNLVTAGSATGGTMWYSLDGTNYSMEIPTGTDAKTYTVYYKVVGDAGYNDVAAQIISVTIGQASQDAPADNEGYAINYAAETITAQDGYEFASTNTAETADISSGSSVTPGSTIYVRKAATADGNHAPSTWVPVSIPARPAAPAAQGVKETAAGKGDGKIAGVDNTMEYSVDGSTWKPCEGTEITNLASGTYYVRVKGTASSFVGTQAMVVVNAGDQLTVTFNSNEGSAVDPANVNYGDKVTKPADPTREHHTFSGWYTSTGDEGVAFDFDRTTITSNITLYAKWTEIVYTGSVSEEDGTVENVTADGLDDVADDRNANVVLIVKAEATTPGDTEQEAIEAAAGSRTLEFLDITLKEEGGTSIEETDSVLTIVIPFEKGNKQNIAVYRYHGTQPETMTENPAPGAEGFVVSADSITIYTKKFSTYAIGYTVPAPPSGGGSYTPTYAITVEKSENGEVKANRSYASSGSTVTITATPKAGYVVDAVTVTDSQGNSIEVTHKSDGTYTFKMPGRKVTVEAVFVPENSFAACTGDSSCPMYGYTDLNTKAWYHDGVHYCIDNGLMSGYGNGIFKPDADTTRAMIIVMLWRLNGSPVVNYLLDFEDVAEGQWYTEAIRWAKSEGIAGGYGNGYFGTNDAITREQMVTILWRYAQHKGIDVSVGEDTNILSYNDAFDVAEYAIPAMQWACGSGMVQGKNDSNGGMILDPESNGSRAQIAAMMQRFCTEIMK